MERESAEDGYGGLPGEAGFNGVDESHYRKIHSILAIRGHIDFLSPLRSRFFSVNETLLTIDRAQHTKSSQNRDTATLEILPPVDNLTYWRGKLFLFCPWHGTLFQTFLLVCILLQYPAYEDSSCTSSGKISRPKLSQVRWLLRCDRV